ncbi:hypothetical protein BGZ98_005806, partial [Dissophora globulifera]
VSEQRRNEFRSSHDTTDEWYEFYEGLVFGVIPGPQDCEHAPPSQKPLAKIPIAKSLRKDSILGHFYISISETEFQCMVVCDSGDICGQRYNKSTGGRSRTNHIINNHTALYDALREFRVYQCLVQGLEQPTGLYDDDIPPTPKRFAAARDDFVLRNMQEPLPREKLRFESAILRLITVRGLSFGDINSDEFKELCDCLNPLYHVPGTDAIQQILASSVMNLKLQIKGYITRH